MKPGRWALGRCLKPHRGEEVRYRASLCGLQLSSGVPALSVACKKKKQAPCDIKQTHLTVKGSNGLNGHRPCVAPYLVLKLLKFEAFHEWANQSQGDGGRQIM